MISMGTELTMQSIRISVAVILSLLPWPAVWFGMYQLNSIVWTFFLYHGLCLLPAICWGRTLWQSHLIKPSKKQIAFAVGTTLLSTILAIAAYEMTGAIIVDKKHVLQVLTLRGFQATYLFPLAVYFVIVNAVLEELFWRGVILNELDLVGAKWRRAGYLWTACAFAAWHWLVLRALIKPGWAEIAVCGVLIMGVLSSWLYRRTNSIIVPIIWHAFVFDFAIIAMFAVLVLT